MADFEHVAAQVDAFARNRCSAAAPASPVKSMQNERYRRMNATEFSLMSLRELAINGSDGPRKCKRDAVIGAPFHAGARIQRWERVARARRSRQS